MREWHPDRVISPEQARRVIADQFPELAGEPVRAFDAGWDNMVIAVGDAWLFRFIHRAIALPGARRELAVLRHLADRFSVPIPWPRFVGRATPEVEWPFWGTAALPGRELSLTPMPDDAREPVARALGTFLRELHDPALAAQTLAAVAASGVVLPVDPIARGRPRLLVPRTRQRLDHLVSEGLWARDPRVELLLEGAERLADPQDPPVLVHGDLHVRHVLVDGGRVSGVIDWGDTALADPAVDLMIAYSAFVGAPREAFFDAYGPVPDERSLRARAAAVHVTAALTDYAAVEGMDSLLAECRAGFQRAVT